MANQAATKLALDRFGSRQVYERIAPNAAVRNLMGGNGAIGVHHMQEAQTTRTGGEVTENAQAGAHRQLPQGLTAIPMLALLRQDTAPLLPLVYPPNNYKTIGQLVQRGKHLERHHLAFANIAPRWSQKKDANNWSALKKIYKRVRDKRVEFELVDNFRNTVSTAQWLDENERKNMTMATYVKHLRTTYYATRK